MKTLIAKTILNINFSYNQKHVKGNPFFSRWTKSTKIADRSCIFCTIFAKEVCQSQLKLKLLTCFWQNVKKGHVTKMRIGGICVLQNNTRSLYSKTVPCYFGTCSGWKCFVFNTTNLRFAASFSFFYYQITVPRL